MEETVLLECTAYGTQKGDKNNIHKYIVIIGDVIYYYKNQPSGLYRYENGESTLIDIGVMEYESFKYEDKLYYMKYTDRGCDLMCYDPEDHSIAELYSFDFQPAAPKIIDGYLYCKERIDNMTLNQIIIQVYP